MNQVSLLAHVALVVDLAEKGLTHGQLGTVVEQLGSQQSPVFLVEFFRAAGVRLPTAHPIVVLALVALAVSCGYRKVPPDRPAGVPAQAVWAGGLNGGSFIFCEVDSSIDVNKCTVYNEDTGQVTEQGDFRLKIERRAARAEELKYAWADWGGRIGLVDGRIRRRVQSPTR